MPIHIKTDMTSTLVNEKTNPDWFNSESGINVVGMQSMVDGMVQMIRLVEPVYIDNRKYTHMGVSEEGKFSGREFNLVATKIATKHNSIMPGDTIVGDAFLVGLDDIH